VVKENTAEIIAKSQPLRTCIFLAHARHYLELMQNPPHLIYMLKDKPIKCKFHSKKYESQNYNFPARNYAASYTYVINFI